MILRRLTKHLRDQNWFAVFLDFFIVVIGVFIGIQVSNWNTDNAQREDETVFLRLLEEDIRGSQELASRTLDTLHRQDKARQQLYAFSVGNAPLIAPQEIPRLLSHGIWEMPTMEFNQTTFEALKSTGRLDVFVDDTLVQELTELQSDIADIERRAEIELHVLFNVTDPFLLQHVDITAMLVEPSSSGRIAIDWLTNDEAPFEPPEILKSMQFRNAILARTTSSQNRMRDMERLENRYQRIAVLIEQRQAELNQR